MLFFDRRKQSFYKNSLPLPFAFEKKLAPTSAACRVFFFFFSFRTKNERASYRTEDRLLNVNHLHGFHGRQRWWSSKLYRLGLMPTDYGLTATPLKWLLMTKLAAPKKKLVN